MGTETEIKAPRRRRSPVSDEVASLAAAPQHWSIVHRMKMVYAGAGLLAVLIGGSAFYASTPAVDPSIPTNGIAALLDAKVRAYQIANAQLPSSGMMAPSEVRVLMASHAERIRQTMSAQFARDVAVVATDLQKERTRVGQLEAQARDALNKANAAAVSLADREHKLSDDFRVKSDALEQQHRDAFEKQRAENEQALKTQRTTHEKEVADLKAMYTAQIQQSSVTHDKNMIALRADTSNQLTKASADAQTAISSANARATAADEAMRKAVALKADAEKVMDSSKREVASYQKEAEAARGALELQKKLTEDQLAKANKLTNDAQAIIANAIKDASQARIEAADARSTKQAEMLKLAETHEANVKALASQLSGVNTQAKDLITSMKAAKDNVDATLDTTKKTAQRMETAVTKIDTVGQIAVTATEVMKNQQLKVDNLTTEVKKVAPAVEVAVKSNREDVKGIIQTALASVTDSMKGFGDFKTSIQTAFNNLQKSAATKDDVQKVSLQIQSTVKDQQTVVLAGVNTSVNNGVGQVLAATEKTASSVKIAGENLGKVVASSVSAEMGKSKEEIQRAAASVQDSAKQVAAAQADSNNRLSQIIASQADIAVAVNANTTTLRTVDKAAKTKVARDSESTGEVRKVSDLERRLSSLEKENGEMRDQVKNSTQESSKAVKQLEAKISSTQGPVRASTKVAGNVDNPTPSVPNASPSKIGQSVAAAGRSVINSPSLADSLDCKNLNSSSTKGWDAALAKAQPTYRMSSVDVDGGFVWAMKPNGGLEPIPMRDVSRAAGC